MHIYPLSHPPSATSTFTTLHHNLTCTYRLLILSIFRNIISSIVPFTSHLSSSSRFSSHPPPFFFPLHSHPSQYRDQATEGPPLEGGYLGDLMQSDDVTKLYVDTIQIGPIKINVSFIMSPQRSVYLFPVTLRYICFALALFLTYSTCQKSQNMSYCVLRTTFLVYVLLFLLDNLFVLLYGSSSLYSHSTNWNNLLIVARGYPIRRVTSPPAAPILIMQSLSSVLHRVEPLAVFACVSTIQHLIMHRYQPHNI